VLAILPAVGTPDLDKETLVEKLQEVEQQARLVLDEMVATPSIHRTRLLHIISLVQQMQSLLVP
jgi:hypothetical protein